jgi:phenylpropionate dioxygenase-like ring-hydroxylating dioxygenase large terminal subunit
MFVRNCWYVAAWDHELGSGPIARTIINEPLVIYARKSGGLVCFEDRCCHRFAPLSKGQVEGDDLRCMYHGLKFAPSGKCIEIPGQDTIPARACVRTYPVAIKHSWVWVWMGDPQRADERLIPAAVGFDDPNWTLRASNIDYDANYLLVNDNLTDFTHLTYVHRNSFGASEEFARTRPDVIPLERGLRIQRWITVPPRADALTNQVPGRKRGGNGTETWQSYDFLAPGILLMRTRTFPAGVAAEFKGREDRLDNVDAIGDDFTSQAVTPMTDKTTRYYFSWGPRKGEGSEQMADGMLGLAQIAFAEDKEMIEAQQRIVDLKPGKEVLTSADLAPMQMRGILERMSRVEGVAGSG